MKIVIIEDETLAAKRLENLVLKYNPAIEVVAVLPLVKSSVKWLNTHPHPDLLFMDIHLEDGQSFAIFEQADVEVPVIFTTAFDEYMVKAFKVNSIDYLLKPINYEELSGALNKYNKLHGSKSATGALKELLNAALQKEERYKSRFLITLGSKIKTISIEETAYFYSEEKITFLVTTAGGRFPVDFSLDKLTEILDPSLFFRVNRQFLVKLPSIDAIHKYSATRLKITLKPDSEKEVFVSTERYSSFKDWLDK
jgi:DNA-binding LytR/AlgR family response regulator